MLPNVTFRTILIRILGSLLQSIRFGSLLIALILLVDETHIVASECARKIGTGHLLKRGATFSRLD